MSEDLEAQAPELYARQGERLRLNRQAALTQLLVNSENQPLRHILLLFSKQTGKSMRTVNEYWEVISEDNRGPIYEKHGIIKVRKPFRKWLERNKAK